MSEEAQPSGGWSDLFNRLFSDLGLRFSIADGSSLVLTRSTPAEISDRIPALAGFDLIPTGGAALGPVLASFSITPAGDLLATFGAAGQPGAAGATSPGPAQDSLSRGGAPGGFAPGTIGYLMLSPDQGGPGLIVDLSKLEIIADGTRYFDLGSSDVVVLSGPLVGHDRGRGAELIFGLGAGDDLKAGDGADVFAFSDAGESSGASFDSLLDFDPGADRIDLPVDVSGFDAAIDSGALSLRSFDADLAAALGAGGLGAGQAVLFAPDGGDLAGTVFLIVDGNGQAGYQAGEDFVFALPTASLADLSAHTDFFV